MHRRRKKIYKIPSKTKIGIFGIDGFGLICKTVSQYLILMRSGKMYSMFNCCFHLACVLNYHKSILASIFALITWACGYYTLGSWNVYLPNFLSTTKSSPYLQHCTRGKVVIGRWKFNAFGEAKNLIPVVFVTNTPSIILLFSPSCYRLWCF